MLEQLNKLGVAVNVPKESVDMHNMATFPGENPQPVWRIGTDGSVLFMNKKAEQLSAGLEGSKGIFSHPVWQQTLALVIKSQKNCEAEIDLQGSWFRCMFVAVNKAYVNIYGADVTARIMATLALKQANALLEDRVVRRTCELEESNEKLLAEIEAHKRSEEKLRQLSYQDELTGLGNRRYISDRLDQMISLSSRQTNHFALFFLDLDHFKQINDSLGHDAGDDLLKQVATRLQSAVRTSDLVARLGGDEFAIMLEGIHSEAEVIKIAQGVISTFHHAFYLSGESNHIYCSLGISLFPDHAKTATGLFKCADIALYKAKELRDSYSIYRDSISSELSHLHRLSHDLHTALEKNQLCLLYQPKVDLASQKVVGAEALIRWNHPRYGVVSPLEFIPIAEHHGLMLPIGDWILEQGCRTLQNWAAAGHDRLCMALNLSPIQFRDERLLEKVSAVLEKYQVAPAQLEFEITESQTMENPDKHIQVIQHFLDMGISVAMDDFGTGYSSLSRLKEMPISTLKIDQSFIKNFHRVRSERVFVQVIINMAKMFGLTTVAEGVERQEHVDFLKELGCDIGQGHHFSKPLSETDFLAFLSQQSSCIG
ncbi:MAG: EAL domain-containing protein [Gammaproteobacteria bacterium]|nr:EAL domain-containing protein [Gammaproteobacteria bacterium]